MAMRDCVAPMAIFWKELFTVFGLFLLKVLAMGTFVARLIPGREH